MDTPKLTEAELQINHLLAERESLNAQLEEYLYIIDTRDKEIEKLKRMLAEKIQFRSSFDNQEEQLQSLQDNIHQLKSHAEGMMNLENMVSDSEHVEHELEDANEQQNYFQTQLAGLQERINELTNRNLLLQQDASRIAELESLLEDAERERDELKERLPPEE
jgi:chromosome segregation ATPase